MCLVLWVLNTGTSKVTEPPIMHTGYPRSVLFFLLAVSTDLRVAVYFPLLQAGLPWKGFCQQKALCFILRNWVVKEHAPPH